MIKSKFFSKTLILVLALFTLLSFNYTVRAEKNEITIGYFPNVTHAAAIVGVKEKIFEDSLHGITIKTRIFPNGSLFMNALSTKQIDIGYVGPGPAINRYLQGADVKALASASTGGTVLVTRKNLKYSSPEDLKGKIVATPALGCTHDLLFRKLIRKYDLATTNNNGEIKHRAQKPATMVGLFATNQLDAAMVSEPWAARMEKSMGAKVVVNWNQVPWDGKLPATIVVTRADFIKQNPKIVNNFLKAHVNAINFIKNNPEKSARIIRDEIARITSQKLSLDIIKRSLERTNITSDIDPQVVQELADLSANLGFIQGDSNLTGFIDTGYLKEVTNENS